MKYLKLAILLCMCACLVLSMTACGGDAGDEWESVVVTKTQKVSNSTTANGDGGDVIGSTTSSTYVQSVTNTTKKDVGLINSNKLTPQEEIFEDANLNGTTLNFVFRLELTNYDNVEGGGDNKDLYAWKVLREKWGVKLKNIVISNNQLPGQVAQMVASGNPPDMGHVSDNQMMRYAYTNLAIPLNDYLVTDEMVWDNGRCFDSFTFNKKIYGTAWHRQEDINFWIYYNKTLFEENNIEDPYELYKAGKWNMEAFKRTAIKATIFESDGTTVKIPGVACSQPILFCAMHGEPGLTELSGGKWKVTLDSAAGMQGLQLVYDLAQAKAYVNAGGMQAKFGQRGSAMLIERPRNAMGNYDYYNTMKDKIGMVPLPMAPDGKYYNFTVCDGSFIFKGAQNPVAAIAYRYYSRMFEYYTSDAEKEAAGYVSDNMIDYSPEHLALTRDHLANKSDKILKSTMAALVNWGDGEKLGSKFWNNLMKNGKQPAQLVDSVKEQLKSCLKSTVGVGNVVG